MLSAKEIAQHYGVTRQAVEKWVKRGNIPYEIIRLVGKRSYKVYDLEDFENYFKSQTIVNKPV